MLFSLQYAPLASQRRITSYEIMANPLTGIYLNN